MHPQVILIDVGLPGIDGAEVARLLKTIFPAAQTPCLIAVTSICGACDGVSGFDSCLYKPLNLDALIAFLGC